MARRKPGSNLSGTFVVLHPKKAAVQVDVTPRVYEELDRRFQGFRDRSLVAIHSFKGDWAGWERHPAGDELVCLLSGSATFVLQQRSGRRRVSLRKPGDFVLVPKGVWHTAKVPKAARMLFVTPGEGTQHKNLE